MSLRFFVTNEQLRKSALIYQTQFKEQAEQTMRPNSVENWAFGGNPL